MPEIHAHVPRDRKLHFVVGMLVACGSILIVWVADHHGLWAACLVSGAAAGVANELIQLSFKFGRADIGDAVTTSGGAALVAAFVAAHAALW